MIRKLLPLAVGLALSRAAFSQGQPPANAQNPPPPDPTIPVTYVGSNLRVSLGVDDSGDVLGEILGILGKTDDHAWLGELWLGHGGSGGVQVDYHWLHGSADASDEKADNATIWKVFGAADQNEWKDRKATVGLGWERQDLTIDGYYSHSISGSRLTNTTNDIVTNTITGTDDGGPYTQVQTIDTLTHFYEHPYENGVGVRLGKYFDDPLIRVHGGVDYEVGHYSSDQVTLSLDGGTGDLFKFNDGAPFVGAASPALVYWDGDTSAANNNSTTGAGTGGSGAWNGSNSAWYNGSSNGAWSAGKHAIFWGIAGTVTLASPQSANSIAFLADGYTLTGSTLTMSGVAIMADTGVTANVASVLAGTLGIMKNGSGTVNLTAANTYGGGTTINAGSPAVSM